MNESEWISVNDRLPAIGEHVLVCEGGQVTTIAYRVKNDRFDPPIEEWSVFSNCSGLEFDEDRCEPDFWMPIPGPKCKEE